MSAIDKIESVDRSDLIHMSKLPQLIMSLGIIEMFLLEFLCIKQDIQRKVIIHFDYLTPEIVTKFLNYHA